MSKPFTFRVRRPAAPAPQPAATPAPAAPRPRAPSPAAAVPAGPEAARPDEIGGPKGPEPTRYGDWEIGGRCIDF